MLKALSVLAFALMIVGFVLQYRSGALFLPVAWIIASHRPRLAHIVLGAPELAVAQLVPALALAAVAMQVGAVALMIWARLTFRARSFHFSANPTEGGLVRTGPYRFIRHPIYTAACLISWPGAVLMHTPAALGASLLVTAGAIARMLCEERLLVGRYPEYAEYARTTRRMVPGLW